MMDLPKPLFYYKKINLEKLEPIIMETKEEVELEPIKEKTEEQTEEETKEKKVIIVIIGLKMKQKINLLFMDFGLI